ncbi:MAG: XrtA/PEP-CTERM system TPR-repeat protein PrsT [Gammaproteobacteria bacterium]
MIIMGYGKQISIVVLSFLFLSGCDFNNPEELVLKAKLHRSQDHVKVAVLELKNILQKYPDNESALAELSEILLEKKQYLEVIDLLSTSIERGLNNQVIIYSYVDALIHTAKFEKALLIVKDNSDQFETAQGLALTGHCYAGLNEVEKAKTYYKKGLLIDPGLISSHLGLAQEGIIQAEKNKSNIKVKNEKKDVKNNWVTPTNPPAYSQPLNVLDESKKHLEKVLEIEPDHVVANYLFATINYFENSPSRTKTSLNKVLNIESNHKESLFLMGKLYLESGHLEKSGEFLNRYLKVAPNDLNARMYFASVLLRRHQPDSALEILKDYYELGKTNSEFLLVLGNAYLFKAENDLAIEYFEQARQISASSVLVKMYTAMGYIGRNDELKNDRKTAIKLLEEVIEVEPENDQASISLITSLLQESEYEQAKKVAEKLIKYSPKAPMPWYLSGIASQSMGDLDHAIIAFTKSLELRHPFIPATIRLAKIYQQKGNYDLASKQFDEALYDSPYNPEIMTEMAIQEQTLGNNDKAVELLKMARSRNSQALSPRLLLGTYYLRLGQINKAQKVLKEMNRLAPDRPDVQMFLGDVKLATNRSTEAVNIFSKLIILKPDSPELLTKYATALRMNGQIEESKKALSSALILSNRNNPESLIEQGKQALLSKNYSEVEMISNDLRSRFPDRSDDYILQGDMFVIQNKFSEAIPAYQAAIAKNQTTGLVLKLHNAFIQSGLNSEASTLLENAAKKQPDNLRLGMTLAANKHESGDSKTAINIYENLLKQHPDNALLLNNYAWIYNEIDLKKALSLAKRAYQATPEIPQIIDSYGWFSVLGGQLEQGQNLLELAVDKSPAEPEFHYHLAEALIRSGKSNSARKSLEIALASQEKFTGRDEAEKLFLKLNREELEVHTTLK